jgi:hypothetical protein
VLVRGEREFLGHEAENCIVLGRANIFRGTPGPDVLKVQFIGIRAYAGGKRKIHRYRLAALGFRRPSAWHRILRISSDTIEGEVLVKEQMFVR